MFSNCQYFIGMQQHCHSIEYFVPQDQVRTGSGRHQKIRFSEDEDARLADLVAKHGTADWNRIAFCMSSRNARQCRERWKNYLDPELRKDEWTFEEDSLLREKFKEFGAKWNRLGKYFVARSDNVLRNRWQVLERQRIKRGVTPHEGLSSDMPMEKMANHRIVEVDRPQQPSSSVSSFSALDLLNPQIDFSLESSLDYWGPFGF
jgi:hypothetical protein